MGSDHVKMIRFHDWPERLDRYISSVYHKPFKYKDFDCCTFASGAVKAITGIDVMEKLKPLYSDKKSALKLMKRLAGAGLVEAVNKVLTSYGCYKIKPLEARRGDVVSFKNESRDIIGICVDRNITAPGEKGLEFFPLESAICAWRIGNG